jgi:hypothetical protein
MAELTYPSLSDLFTHTKAPPTVTRTDLDLGPTGIGFVLDDFFTPEECAYYIKKAAEVGFQQCQTPSQWRSNERVILKSSDLAHQVYSRLVPQFQHNDLKYLRPFGFDNSGVWKPTRVNDCVKISRYPENTFFVKHRDNSFIYCDDERSILSVVIYLNQNFQGGKTTFETQKISDTTETVAVTPKIGRALIFNHDHEHSGTEVASGEKYIMKLEVMFQRTDKGLASEAENDREGYEKAERLYETADRLEREGDLEGSLKLFCEATEIQAKYRSVSGDPIPFPPEILIQWSKEDVLRDRDFLSLMLTSKSWFLFLRHSELWKQRYKKSFPSFRPEVFFLCEEIDPELTKLHQRKPQEWERPQRTLEDIQDVEVDWYLVFQRRMKGTNTPADITIVDTGSDTFKAGYLLSSEGPSLLPSFLCHYRRANHQHYILSGHGMTSGNFLASKWEARGYLLRGGETGLDFATIGDSTTIVQFGQITYHVGALIYGLYAILEEGLGTPIFLVSPYFHWCLSATVNQKYVLPPPLSPPPFDSFLLPPYSLLLGYSPRSNYYLNLAPLLPGSFSRLLLLVSLLVSFFFIPLIAHYSLPPYSSFLLFQSR